MKSHLLFVITAALVLLTSCTTGWQKRNILVIGDSNGAAELGWVFQFQQLRKGGPIVNTSVGGNTIGFDGMGQARLNTLNQLSVYLRRGYAEMGAIDEIIIALGTNDCKYEYRDATADRHVNFRELLSEINDFFVERGQDVPRLVVVSPPALAGDASVSDEFKGGAVCVAEMANFLEELATKRGYCYVNLIEKPGQELLKYSNDGIHFDAIGYEKIARRIVEVCY